MKKINSRKWSALLGLILCMSTTLVACSGGIGTDLPLNQTIDSGTKNLAKNRDKDTIYCFTDDVMAWDGYDEDSTVEALTEFSLRLFEQNISDVEHSSNNILISPTSVISALGMTTFGAKGETLTQMESIFGVYRAALNAFNHQYLVNPSEELKLANSIWFTNDERLTVKEEFLQFNEECYGTDIYETAFNEATVDAINSWVEKNTDGMIKNVLDEIPADAVMYLINALAFEAEWEEKYDSTQIRKGATFTSADGEKQKVTMMNSEENLYLEDKNAKGFIKYYKDKNYAFAALLPNEGVSLGDYVTNLTGEKLQDMLENPQKTSVDVKIPQFSYEYEIEMSEILEQMGMPAAFDSNEADFTDMAISTRGNIYINRVIHKTFIEVSPVGTKAGAATVVEMMDECCMMQEKEVYLDRPFLYMIIDCESNMPVFIGCVNEIEQ